jgi:hypothetical protein
VVAQHLMRRGRGGEQLFHDSADGQACRAST